MKMVGLKWVNLRSGECRTSSSEHAAEHAAAAIFLRLVETVDILGFLSFFGFRNPPDIDDARFYFSNWLTTMNPCLKTILSIIFTKLIEIKFE